MPIRETEVAFRRSRRHHAAYRASVVSVDGRRIVFIDTTGPRGVHADAALEAQSDRVVCWLWERTMASCRQTLEAIDHAKAAGVLSSWREQDR